MPVPKKNSKDGVRVTAQGSKINTFLCVNALLLPHGQRVSGVVRTNLLANVLIALVQIPDATRPPAVGNVWVSAQQRQKRRCDQSNGAHAKKVPLLKPGCENRFAFVGGDLKRAQSLWGQ